MKNLCKAITLTFLTGVLSVGLTSCNSGEGDSTTSASQSTLEKIQEEGVIRIGYANEAPYAYEDIDSNRVTGEAPEIARHVAAELGVENVEGVLTEFGALIPGLKAGRFDIIAAGMYIKPKRCEQINFSDPTYKIGEALVVEKGNPHDIHSYEDIAQSDELTIGVVTGAIELEYAEAVGIRRDRIQSFPNHPSAVAGVASGRVDAYAGTALTVQDMVDKDQSGKVERAVPFTNPVIDGTEVAGYGAFGFRKEDEELRAKFDEVLDTFIGTEEHLNMVRPFGFTESELPGDVTASELCTE